MAIAQSITDNTTLSVERILDRINDGHFIAKCTFNGKPDMERRVSYCQVRLLLYSLTMQS